MEKLTFSVRLEVDRFKRIWENWIKNIKTRSDFMRCTSGEKNPSPQLQKLKCFVSFYLILFYYIRYTGNMVKLC